MNDKKKKDDEENDYEKELPTIISELIFVLLPFIVIIVINLSKTEYSELIYSSNYSLVATILFGQSIIKLIMGVASYDKELAWRAIGLITTTIIALGLIPSIIVLTLFTISTDQNLFIVTLQFILFTVSILSFITFGPVGQSMSNQVFSRKIQKILSADENL